MPVHGAGIWVMIGHVLNILDLEVSRRNTAVSIARTSHDNRIVRRLICIENVSCVPEILHEHPAVPDAARTCGNVCSHVEFRGVEAGAIELGDARQLVEWECEGAHMVVGASLGAAEVGLDVAADGHVGGHVFELAGLGAVEGFAGTLYFGVAAAAGAYETYEIRSEGRHREELVGCSASRWARFVRALGTCRCTYIPEESRQ